MPDSKRKQITDAIISAVSGVTGMGKVTQDEEDWARADGQDLPICFVAIQKPAVLRVYFEHPTADDMEAELAMRISCQSLSEFGSTKRADVDALMKNIEIALAADSAVEALVLDLHLVSDTIDIGSSENRGFCYLDYTGAYQYNHATP